MDAMHYAMRWDRIKDFLREKDMWAARRRQSAVCGGRSFPVRAGIPWRDLPERFGDWKIVHQRFSRWAKSGVFERIFKLLASDPDNEYMMIDATIVRAQSLSGEITRDCIAFST